jgi:hypothetical protein
MGITRYHYVSLASKLSVPLGLSVQEKKLVFVDTRRIMAGAKLCLGQRNVEPVAVDLPYVPIAFGRDLLGSSRLFKCSMGKASG